MRAQEIVDALLEWGGPGGLATSEWTGYWMDSKGIMHLVSDHLGWARRYVLKDQAPSDNAGVYSAMSRLGWLKIVVEFRKIYVHPTRALRNQMDALQEFAIENRMPILDQQTGRKIFDPKDDKIFPESDREF